MLWLQMSLLVIVVIVAVLILIDIHRQLPSGHLTMADYANVRVGNFEWASILTLQFLAAATLWRSPIVVVPVVAGVGLIFGMMSFNESDNLRQGVLDAIALLALSVFANVCTIAILLIK